MRAGLRSWMHNYIFFDMAKKFQTGLGKGLSALLSSAADEEEQKFRERRISSSPLTAISEIPLEDIVPNPFQPRTEFIKEKIDELADSIRLIGIIQPITVKKLENGRYQIISGERRFRASRLAGRKTIPAYIKDADESAMLEMAIVENIQREDLDPIEVSLSFQRLMDECDLTQEALSQRVGKNRATVANFLRLLKLPPEIQLIVKSGKISMGHAKALLALNNENAVLKLVNRIIEEDLSVRQTENLVKSINTKGAGAVRSPKVNAAPSESEREVGDILGKFFKNPISIKSKAKGKGEIVIRYKSDEELKEFLLKLKEHNL